jgi:signal transduction histidine kinase
MDASPRGRAERLIAAGRVVLAGSALFAVWLDPSEPAKYAAITYALLAANNVYSAAIALRAWRWREPPRHQGLVTHVFDLVFFSSFIYLTDGPSSPFNAYFLFSLTCATLRWQWRGTLWTALAALVVYLGFGLFFADDPSFELDPFVIRGVYMAVMAVLLANLGAHEQWMRREMSLFAASEERNRLARDLHDGVLQSLTGIGLHLAAVRRQLDDDPDKARESLSDLQRLIALEQRDLRFYISEVRPPLSPTVEPPGLSARLAELVRRLELEWGLAVELSSDGIVERVPESMTRDLYHLVREALINAVRHGEASTVAVEIAGRGNGAMAVTVADNGRGFPFQGRFTQEELAARRAGPKTLSERVGSLGGTLAVDSGPAGARLEIVLPLQGA